MTEKTIEIEFKEKPSVVAVLKTAYGDAKLRFKRLKKNELFKLQIDLQEDSAKGTDAILKLVLSVENLIIDNDPVTLEDIHSGNIYPELSGVICDAYFMVLGYKDVSETEIKKENAVADEAAA